MATEDTEGTETNDDGEFTAEDAEGRREGRREFYRRGRGGTRRIQGLLILFDVVGNYF